MKPTLRSMLVNHRLVRQGSFLTLLLILLISGAATRAASITFSAPTTIAGDTEVFNAGELTYGYNWATAQTVNGVPFAATTGTATVGSGNISLSGFGSTS